MASVQDLFRINSGQVYLYLNNEYWWVADEPTLAGVFGSSPSIQPIESLPSGAQMGPTLAPGSGILQPDGSENTYLVCTGLKPLTCYLITAGAQAYFQLNGTKQTVDNQVISDWLMAAIADGPPIYVPSLAKSAEG